jgi:DNA-binding NarL/FixJ family response regulator/class 3 adenylate cyclase
VRYKPCVGDLPSGIVTLLFTDLDDTPELGRLGPEAYKRVMAEHRELVRAAVAGSGGQEVDCRGGELLAVFERPRDAVHAAVDIQRTHRDHDWAEAGGIRARVGVHTGEPILAEDSYLGLDVHRVVRLCGAGHGDQILVSQTTRTLLQDGELPGSVLDLGEVEFPGLSHPDRVYQLVVDGLPSEFPPLHAPEPPPQETPDSTGGPRVVLAEDAVLLREGMAVLLENHGCDVVGQAGTADELLLKVRSYEPDIAIVDVRMPPTHTDEGLRAAQEIRAKYPDVGVLVLSQYVEPAYAVELVADSPEGVGYLLKDRVNDVKEFLDAVRRVAGGGTAFDPKVVSELVGRRKKDGVLDELSPREREVLALMAEGRSNQAISEQLYLSARAVERHVTSIFTKLRLPAGAEDNRRVLAVLAFLGD